MTNRFIFYVLFVFVLTTTCYLAAQDNAEPADASAAKTAAAVNETKIIPIKGGYQIQFPTLTNVNGFALQPGLSGEYEMFFDASLQSIDEPPTPVKDLPSMLAIADYWIVRNKPERAVALYRRGLEIEPKNLLLKNNLALLTSVTLHDHQEALRIIDDALSTDGRNEHVVLLDSKGLILMQAGNVAQAIPLFERCVELSCQGPLYVLHLADALAKTGNQDARAASWFHKVRNDLSANSSFLMKDNKEMFDNLDKKFPVGSSGAGLE
ncbi:MAG: tetratricopeptide repeat protein [Planctomycetaceae bacterium]|jgi:tetratricopeptide (TPR) repeat protein|nr:tetratricopeptide repeat protein [Planctomycetaceae bacterium]